MIDREFQEILLAVLGEQRVMLKRVAEALERAVPPRPDLEDAVPAGRDALTTVTPALRKQWADQERQRQMEPEPSQSTVDLRR